MQTSNLSCLWLLAATWLLAYAVWGTYQYQALLEPRYSMPKNYSTYSRGLKCNSIDM